MHLALRISGVHLMQIVEGTYEKPTSTKYSTRVLEDRVELWERANEKVKRLIRLMCDDSMRMVLQPEWTANQTWNHLKDYFTPVDRRWDKKWEILGRLDQLHPAQFESLDDFYDQMMKAQADLKEYETTMDDHLTFKTLSSIDARYTSWETLLSQEHPAQLQRRMPFIVEIHRTLKQRARREMIGKTNIAPKATADAEVGRETAKTSPNTDCYYTSKPLPRCEDGFDHSLVSHKRRRGYTARDFLSSGAEDRIE